MHWLKTLALCCTIALLGSACKRKPKPKPVKRVQRTQSKPKPRPRIELPLYTKTYPEEVILQGSSFQMGSPYDEVGRKKIEGPQHKVTLTRIFSMWRHEVTQKEFKTFAGYRPSHFAQCGDDCPVETVSWHEAAAFCNELSFKRGLSTCYRCRGRKRSITCHIKPSYAGKNYYKCPGFRLPTEAEWEFAARAGSTGPLYALTQKKKNRMQASVDVIAWHGRNAYNNYIGVRSCPVPLIEPGKNAPAVDPHIPNRSKKCGTQQVGNKQPNAFGLYDMLGNVSEWVYDRYGKYYNFKMTDPVQTQPSRRVMFRGCNWFQMPQECRIAQRFWGSPAIRNFSIGFRPARSLGLRK